MDHFFLLGDIGSGDPEQYRVGERMYEKIKELNKKDIFVCGLGDNIYEGGCESIDDPQFISKFEKPYEKISNDVKFYMCLGNHDYGHNLDLTNNAKYQVSYGIQSQKRGMKWYMPHRYYTFKKKNVQFFVMDTNYEFMDKNEKDEQFKFLVKEINNSNKQWKILIGHHTLRSIGGHGNAEKEMEDIFQKLSNKCSIDLYICGHDHNKQVIETKSGGKKISLVVCGTGGKKYHDVKNYKNVKDGELHFASSNLGYGLCRCSKKQLIIDFYDDNNNIEYIYKINKP